MSDLNKHVKSDKIKWIITGIAILVILVLLAGILASIITETNPKNWFKKKESSDSMKQVIENALDVEIENSPQLLLAQGDTVGVTTAEGDRYLEATLTATVLPEEATNKDVLWTIEWQVERETDISEYWQIVSTINTNTINIRLLKSGDNVYPANVTVTTVDGGFTASAIVSYGFSVDSISVYRFSCACYEAGKIKTSAESEKISENVYQIPFLTSVYSTSTDKKRYGFTFYLLDFFGNKLSLGADSTFAQSNRYKELKFSFGLNGSSVPLNAFYEYFDWYEYARYFHLYFYITGDYRDFNIFSNGLDIKAENTRTGKTILNINVRFTMPVESVSLSQTEIIF